MRSVALGITFLLAAVGAAAAQPTELRPGARLERSISPGDRHEYLVEANAKQRVHIVVDQKHIDLVVTVVGPDGNVLMSVDSPSSIDDGMTGPEDVSLAAMSAGTYKVSLVPFVRPDAKPGSYVIALIEQRSLTAGELANELSKQEISTIERQWESAVDQNDTATMGGLMSDDGVGMGPQASATLVKAQHLAQFDQMREQYTKLGATRSHTVSEHVIRVFGDTAVTTGRAVITTTIGGSTASTISGQFVHVWKKRDSGWRLLVDHFTPYGRLPASTSAVPPLDAATLNAYVGTYNLESEGGTLTVGLRSDKLEATIKTPFYAIPNVELRPLSEVTFAIGDREGTFVRAANGDVIELLIIADGTTERATRRR